jgi:acetoacetyl-CoA reductase
VKAFVTGAARGIGAAIAERLRADGMEVVTADLADGCDLRLDVARDEFPDLGDVDVCVANAAITNTIAPAHRMTPEQWQRDIDVNLTGAFRTVQACLPGMRERRYGRIVLISSGAARGGLPGQAAYAASKAGLLGLVMTLAAENARRGITANAVLPGMVATEVVKSMPAEVLERVTAALPARRMVEIEEVAALVAFLASPAAGSVTGEAIGVDGELGGPEVPPDSGVKPGFEQAPTN